MSLIVYTIRSFFWIHAEFSAFVRGLSVSQILPR